MKHLVTFLAAVICGCIGFLGYQFQAAEDMRIADYALLSVTDKAAPIVEVAQDAEEEWQEEHERLAEEAAQYVYYAPRSVWYESDDADAEAEAKEWIAWRESGGDYDARNGQYIGRYQLSADKLDGDWSEENQEATAEAYVQGRYGSWQAAKEFWQENGWY